MDNIVKPIQQVEHAIRKGFKATGDAADEVATKAVDAIEGGLEKVGVNVTGGSTNDTAAKKDDTA